MLAQDNFYTTNMEATTKTEPIILWLLAAVTTILLASAIWSARPHTAARTIHWQTDTSWVKSW